MAKQVWHVRPDGLRVDSSGYSEAWHRKNLDAFCAELDFLVPLYDQAIAEDFGVADAIHTRIDECRSNIYWLERKLAME